LPPAGKTAHLQIIATALYIGWTDQQALIAISYSMPIASFDVERLFRFFPSPYMVLDTQLRFIDMNDIYLSITQRTREELMGQYVFDAFPESEERLLVFKSAFERALAGEHNQLVKEPFSLPVSLAQGGGMRDVWWTCHHLPVYDRQGNICGMLQNAEDVTAHVTSERMRAVIGQEFGHRVKNILSTIISIARQTARSAKSTETFVSEFQGRIDAMARTHQTLADGAWERLTLETLLQSQLQTYAEQQRKATLSGPDVELSARHSEVLGMAFHELATNAAKYGAFFVPNGQLHVDWSVDTETGMCTIRWVESGVALSDEISATGFGSKIIDRVLPMELSGTVIRDFTPDGLVCTILFPIDLVERKR
jgi:PAS domain S-box-containing protein